MSAAAVSPEETEQLWDQQGNPLDSLLNLNWKSPYFFHHLLVQCHRPAVENSAADNSENLVSNYLTTNQRAFIPEQQTLNTACRILQDPSRTVPGARVAVETPVMISMLQDTEENDLCLDDHSAP